MKTSIKSSLSLFALVFLALACNKPTNPKPPTEIGGKGGTAIILATPQHHGKNIDSCVIYIRYNATDSGKWDDSARCVAFHNKPTAIFTGLTKGSYYVYGLGWDPAYVKPVHNGAALHITSGDSTYINVAVNEFDLL